MGDPLSLLDSIHGINNRLGALKTTSDRRASNEEAHMWGWGKPSVTCPPSTHVVFQAGWFYYTEAWPVEGWWSNALTAEFEAGGNCEVSAFTSAGYYRGIVVGHVYRSLAISEGTECATVAEAIEDIINVGLDYYSSIPLAIIVVKNNGELGIPGAVLPVDGANRGRSFFYRRIRPWLHIHVGGHFE